MNFLENIDIDKRDLQNINVDKILYQFWHIEQGLDHLTKNRFEKKHINLKTLFGQDSVRVQFFAF